MVFSPIYIRTNIEKDITVVLNRNIVRILKEKIKKRKKLVQKKLLLKADVIYIYFFHLSVDMAISTTQI